MRWSEPASLKAQTWLYETEIETEAAGRFTGPMVVTMRLMSPAQAVVACQLTSRFVYNHGAPLHMGDPSAIGVDLGQPIVGPPLDAHTRRTNGAVLGLWCNAAVGGTAFARRTVNRTCTGACLCHRPAF